MIFINLDDILKTTMKESKISKSARNDIIEACRRMSPAQRLNAFLEHSQAQVRLLQAGRAHRANLKKTK